MIKLTMGQAIVLTVISVPMAAVGTAGAIATFGNMKNILKNDATALGMMAASEGATLICAMVCFALTLMGQQTPAMARAGMWLLPIAASAIGVYMAKDDVNTVVMGFTPMAMTASGEGIALVARRIVAFQTGTDLEQQRRSGLLLWHANRAANGGLISRKLSKAAVWRLTRAFATTDGQLSVQLGEIQRYRIGEGADTNLAAVLYSSDKTSAKPVKAPELPPVALPSPAAPELPAVPSEPAEKAFTVDGDDGYDFVKEVLAEAEEQVALDDTVRLLTVADVATLKHVAPGTVRSWVNRGKLAVAERDGEGRSLFHPLEVASLD